jgi:hypothetical protein
MRCDFTIAFHFNTYACYLIHKKTRPRQYLFLLYIQWTCHGLKLPLTLLLWTSTWKASWTSYEQWLIRVLLETHTFDCHQHKVRVLAEVESSCCVASSNCTNVDMWQFTRSEVAELAAKVQLVWTSVLYASRATEDLKIKSQLHVPPNGNLYAITLPLRSFRVISHVCSAAAEV